MGNTGLTMGSRQEQPASPDEAAELLRDCAAGGLRLRPRGGGTKLGWGRPVAEADVEVLTASLDRVVEHNAGDLTALHKVTEPRAFSRLMSMRSDAINLRLKYCTPNPRGDFTCYFRHDFPASEHKTGHGQAVFIAAPALNPGWYMYQFQSCD